MTDRQERLGIVVYVEDQATGKLTKVKAEVAGLGPAGAAAGRGLATGAASIERSTGRISGALSHARGAIGGLLTGPLGMLGLGAGLFTLGGAFESGLSKAQTWGLQIEKLQGITHNSAESLSGLLAVTEKYGLSNERLAQIAGFTQKALGNLEKGITDEGLALAGTTGPSDAVLKAQERLRVATIRLDEVESKRKHSLSSLVSAQNSVKDAQRALTKALSEGEASVGGADKFLKDYGFDIRDAKGNVKDFSTLLLTFSDYWNGNTAQGLKAAAAAKLFGRGYADLVPILNLGSKGIREAEEEAKALGLTLTQDNIVALSKAREATRQWGDALGGLELQLGLALLPKLTQLATWATSFVSQHGHEIISFFTGVADFAGQAAGTIGDLAGAANAFWSSIPAPLRDLMVTGFVADRTIHFLFGFSPLQFALGVIAKPIEQAIAGSALGRLAGGIFSRGSSPANPMWVQQVGGAGGLPGTAGGRLSGLLGLLGFVSLAALVTEIAVQVSGMNDPAHQNQDVTNRYGGHTFRGTFNDQGQSIDPFTGRVTGAPIPPFRDSTETRAAQITAQALIDFRASERADWTASTAALGKAASIFANAPWLPKLEASWRKAGQTMHDKIQEAIKGLSGPHAGAAAAFLGSKLGNAGFGAGGYDQAQHVLTLLRAMKQSPEVVAAIHRLEGRLTRLKLDRDDLAAAEKIAESSDPKNKKLDELNKLMADLKAHGDRTAQKKLGDIISAVKAQHWHVKVVVPETVNVSGYGTGVGAKVTTGHVSVTEAGAGKARGGPLDPNVPTMVGEEGPELAYRNYIFNANQTRAMLGTSARSGSGLTNALGHVTNPTARAAIERNLERLVAALEASAARPHVARVSHRDFEAAQIRRQAVGPSRARQFALSGG